MRRFFKALVLLPTLLGAISCAADDYGNSPAAMKLVDELVSEEGFERGELQRIFASARKQNSILKAISKPAEKVKPWYEYRKIFVNEQRETEGVQFYNAHRGTLQRAERELGVPAEIIVAILGVETYYGRLAGSYRVIDALSTLAFDYPRRAPFFTDELKDYLILTRDQGLDPLILKGSYAGAMGYGQFMPSSYRDYAIDFDGDGVADIWNNPVDAIGSVANYFKHHGWRTGDPVVYPAKARPGVPDSVFVQGRDGLRPERTIAEFATAGVTADAQPNPEAQAIAMKFQLQNGHEYWLGMHNFYVITQYNHSAMYAMSVYQLSQRLAARVAG